MICSQCNKPMQGPELIKTKVPLPPITDCPQCEEFRRHGSRLTFVKIFSCVDCYRVVSEQMTSEEIKAHKFDFHWGSVDIKDDFKEKILNKAIKEKTESEKSEKLTKEVMLEMEDRELLEMFLNKVKSCPNIHRVYLVDAPQAPHMIAKGWKVIELHMVPIGRPPYFELEKTINKEVFVEDEISEMFGERAMIKIGEHIILVRIIENPVRLGHV